MADVTEVVVGIDLGTTYSVVAACRKGRVEVFANDNGNRTTPSIVGFLNGETYVGDAAKDLPAANQVFDAKRLVGRQWSDLNIQKDKAVWPFEVVEEDGVPRIRVPVGVGDKVESFAPEEISAMVLSDLKETAEAALEQKVTKAVVTVPAYFNEKQCQATKDACRIAGLEVLSMINEPTAAAMAYGLEREKGISFAKTVFIFDLGGGTFDVSVMKISGSACQVLASGGDTHLGGQDFDVLLLEHCLEDLKKTLTAGQIETLMEDKQAMQDLRRACELAKRKLSNMPQAQIAVFFPRLSKSYQTTITRAIFEDLCTALFKKTIQVSEQVLADAKVTRAQVHDVVLVGGSTRIPKVRALLRDMFGGKELRQSINPDEAVAHGAAVHAAVLTGDKFVDRTVQLKDEKEPKRTVPETPTASHAAEAIMSQKGVDLRDGPGAAVGIDLGTTYSVVGACRRGKVEIFANDSGSRTTPSIVGFLNDQSFVGDAAKDLPAANQVFDAKRLVGRQWSDQNIQQDRGVWPFEVVEQDGVPRIKVDVGGREETFAPEEISGMVLRDLKDTAEGALGQTVSKAVVTVPAYFNERQRQATKDACRIAGLEVLGMINEPTAAAIAYGLDKEKNVSAGQTKTVFIYDLGGGTFDVSVMKISGSDFQVLASGGDTHLGGQDFDVLLLKHCLEDAQRQFNADLSNDKQAVQDLRKACELAKRKLSNMPQAQVSVFLPRLNKGFQTTISRAFFEDLCAELFRKTIQVSEEVLADAKVTRAEVNDVVLVGGSTRIPKVRALLRDMFGGKELRQSINPDEAVAYGAAVQAAVLTGDNFLGRMVALKDVTPLSLGIATVGEMFSCIIEKNTPIPCKNTKTYYTVYDNQSEVNSEVYQGERPLVRDNHYLNKDFGIEVPRLPKGQAKVSVTFEIDQSGLLTVTCVEPTSGRQVQVRVTPQEAHLSEADIQAMIEKANRYKREDQDALRDVEEQLRRQRLL